MQSLLYQRECAINDSIKVVIPTVGEVIDHESSYYGLVTLLTAVPMDLAAQLDDAGIDFTTINEWDLFLLLFRGVQMQDTSLVLGDLDLKPFELAVNNQNGNVVLLDEARDIVIDRAVYERIADMLRRIHHLEKNTKRPANKAAKDYLIKRARDRMKQRRNRELPSQIEPLIIALVNTEQYKYNFEETRNLTIFQFNQCVRQIVKKVHYDNLMHGVYAGTVDTKALSHDDLNWLNNKN